MLTPKDRELIAEAIKQGIAPEPPSTSQVVQGVLRALIAVVVGLLLFLLFWTQRGAVPIFLSESALEGIGPLAFREPGGTARWEVKRAFVRAAHVLDPRSRVSVSVPIGALKCEAIAEQLGADCLAGAIELVPPVRVAWPTPARLIGRGSKVAGVTADVNRSPRAVVSGGLVTRSHAPVQLCFTQPETPTRIRLEAGVRRAHARVPDSQRILNCEDSLSLQIIPARSGDMPVSTIGLERISDLSLLLSGPSANLQGIEGTLSLAELGRHVINAGAGVSIIADDGSNVSAALSVRGLSGSLDLRSASARSVVTAEGELVPTWWDRWHVWVIPGLGTYFTLLVQPTLAAANRRVRWLFSRRIGQ